MREYILEEYRGRLTWLIGFYGIGGGLFLYYKEMPDFCLFILISTVAILASAEIILEAIADCSGPRNPD
jgi:hypothetical protein